jgi:glutaredoxin
MFTIIGRDTCAFCTAAKELLDLKHQIYVCCDISSIDKKSGLWLHKPNDHVTVPVIFDGNNFVGGYRELCIYLNHTS